MGAFRGGPVEIPQFAGAGEHGEIPLAQHFKGADGYGIRQIQAAESVQHGDAHTLVGMVKQEFFRQTGGFFSEEEVARVGIGNVGITVLCLCGEKEKIPLVFLEKLGEAIVCGKCQIGPIIQAGMTKFFIFQFKAHGAHKVEGSAGNGAGTGNVSRVLRDFWFNQNNVEVWQIVFNYLSFGNFPRNKQGGRRVCLP